jgi:hypothetical protein
MSRCREIAEGEGSRAAILFAAKEAAFGEDLVPALGERQ